MEGILALDPAGPIFSSNSENSIHAPLGNKLWKTDAKAVQALHTNVKGSFHLGYDGDLGSVDFYLNDATTQPGCYDMYCSHSYGQQLLISLNAAYSEIGYRNDNEMHCHNSKLVILLIRISLTSPSALLLQGVPSARGLGWVDLDFEYSTVCPILPGLMGIWQKWQGSWARWWNTQIKVNPTQVHEQMGIPVEMPPKTKGQF